MAKLLVDEKSPLVESPLVANAEKDDIDESLDLSFGLIPWLQDLSDKVGYKLLVILFVVEHVMRGFVDAAQKQGTKFIFSSYSVPAPTMSIYDGIIGLPWALKPIIGLVSDLFPVSGYNKMPYMIASSMVGAVSYFAVGFLPQSALPITLVVICFFGIALQLSTCDILAEAKYAEKIRQIPAYGPHILTFVWFGMNAGDLLGTAVGGVLISSFTAKSPYMLAFFPALIVMLPIWMNYLEESPISSEQVQKIRDRFYKQKEACWLCLAMAASCASITFVGLVSSDPVANCIVAGSIFVIMLTIFTIVLNPIIAAFNAWSFIQTSFSLSTGSAAFYFMTDTPKQYPEGPHFSTFFYTTVLGVTMSVVSLLGIVSYQKFASTWRYRNMLVIVNVALGLFNLLDIVFYSRLNVKWGIPDHAFVLGTSVFGNILGQWQWMPQVIILSYLCPKGMEATMYALLAGCHNLGNTVASNFSALLLTRFDVRPDGSDGESEQFENLWKASAVAAVLPVIPVVILFKLVPDVKQGDTIMEPDADATTGSLLSKWLGSEDDDTRRESLS